MTPVVVFPDAAFVVVDYLRAELAARAVTVAVGTRVPNPRPPMLVRVERTGGPKLNMVADGAQVSLEMWAATEEAAHDLAQLCRGLVNAMRGRVLSGVAVYRVVEAGGPQLLPDPLSDHPRFVQTFQVAMRGPAE